MTQLKKMSKKVIKGKTMEKRSIKPKKQVIYEVWEWVGSGKGEWTYVADYTTKKGATQELKRVLNEGRLITLTLE